MVACESMSYRCSRIDRLTGESVRPLWATVSEIQADFQIGYSWARNLAIKKFPQVAYLLPF